MADIIYQFPTNIAEVQASKKILTPEEQEALDELMEDQPTPPVNPAPGEPGHIVVDG